MPLDQLRHFFALWPDDGTRDRVIELSRRLHADYGGRLVARESLHMTLAFLGETLTSRIPTLEAMGRGITTASFNLALTHAGGWPGGIVWLAPGDLPKELAALTVALRVALQSAGFRFDAKRFVPHMTLLRKAHGKPAEMAIAPLEFAVRDFVLVRTLPVDSGVRYEVVSRFPLDSG